MRMSEKGAHHHIIDDTHALEGRRHLKRTTDPETCVRFWRRFGHVLTVENDLAAGGDGIAGKAVEKCGFAGTVWTNQTNDLSFADRQVRIADRKEIAERF
jgi:hypothetical protein